MIIQIILGILVIVFFLLWRTERKVSKFYWERWNYFEGKYYRVYAAWIKKLSPEELFRVQQHSIDEGKDSFELDEPLKKVI